MNDLMLKPETAGTSLLRPSAQRASEAASLAAFNDLLNQLDQVQRRMPDQFDKPQDRAATTRSDLQGSEEAKSPKTDRFERDNAVDHDRDSDRNADAKEHTPARESQQPSNGEPRQTSSTKGEPSANANDGAPGAAYEANPAAIAAAAATTPNASQNTLAEKAAARAGASGSLGGNSAAGLTIAAGKVSNPVAVAAMEGAGPGGNQPNGPKNPLVPASADELPDALKGLVSQNRSQNGAKGSGAAITAETTAGNTPPNRLLSGSTQTVADLATRADTPIEVSFETKAANAQPRSPVTSGLLATQEVNANSTASGPQPGTNQAASSATTSGTQSSGGATTGSDFGGITQPGALTTPSSFDSATLGAAKGQTAAVGHAAGNSGTPLASFGAGPGHASPLAPGNLGLSSAPARSTPPIPVPADQFAVHVARAAAAGTDQISIKLKPAALGQVDVKLEVAHDGRVAAVVTAENPETLDLLQRDAKALERALQDAGLKTDSNSLQFNLRGEGGTGREFGQGGLSHDAMPFSGLDEEQDGQIGPMIAGYQNSRAAQGGIDISV